MKLEKRQIYEMWGMIRKMGWIQPNREIPVLISEGKQVISNSEKVEVLVKNFVKVHSNRNISEEMRLCRENKMKENPNILEQRDVQSGP